MSTIKYVISVNGRAKFNLELDSELTNQEIESAVMDESQYKKAICGCQPKKCIIVRNKMVNFII